MTKKIAVAGKGGTGKTTLATLLIRHLINTKRGKSILAVDADANANLNEALGLEVEETISTILENVKKPGEVPTGMTKDIYIEYRMNQALVETESLDLLVMGNPQGPGCYCFPLDLLRKHMEKLSKNYDYLIVDNEAGLEHLSRKILPAIDYLFITSDATIRGVKSAGRIYDIVRKLSLEVSNVYLIISRNQEKGAEKLQSAIDETGLRLLGTVPYDHMLYNYDLQGRPLMELPSESEAVKAVESLAAKLGI